MADQHQSAASRLLVLISVPALLLAFSMPASAQFGIGARMTTMHTDTTANDEAVRFFGGQIRAHLSKRAAFEFSLDRHREESGDLTQRVVDYPLQATMMMYLVRSTFSPYLLGGYGWYKHKIQDIADDKTTDIVSTTRTGWHAGIGAEISAGRHIGIHADYRYTFLHFGDSDSLIDRVRPSYQGSMWTAGATFYF